MQKFCLYFLIVFSVIEFARPFALHCQFGVNDLRNLGSVYRCLANNVVASSGNAVTSVVGTHQTERTHDDVKVLLIQNSHDLRIFPRNVRIFFPNIIGISLTQTSIKTLNGDELNEYGAQLIWFGIVLSHVVEVPSNFFLHTPNVVNVWFSNNQIERVGNDLLTPLNKNELKIVDFILNRCINNFAETIPNIVALIDDLRRLCPLDGGITTTTENSSNFIGNYKNLNILIFLFGIRKFLKSQMF
ncbi:hypothetical protein PVAND_015361 [Polypedilum vanderplanki]|uniref:Uncharacterized protein n=1 Tax=Polypedilum vanderplanki TaxID=319348 RepID=A0A9J6BCV9_POLVA|nr:hypothetical protein PVAND_015361 [Polypedilum vanderplanki]